MTKGIPTLREQIARRRKRRKRKHHVEETTTSSENDPAIGMDAMHSEALFDEADLRPLQNEKEEIHDHEINAIRRKEEPPSYEELKLRLEETTRSLSACQEQCNTYEEQL